MVMNRSPRVVVIEDDTAWASRYGLILKKVDREPEIFHINPKPSDGPRLSQTEIREAFLNHPIVREHLLSQVFNTGEKESF